jgi:hypothetical protein
MTGPLEDRIRAHFADVTSKVSLPETTTRRTVDGAVHRPGRALLALATAAAIAMVAAAVLVRDEDERAIRTVAPTTTEPPPSTSTTSSTTSTTATPIARLPVVVLTVSGVAGWWDGEAWIQPSQGESAPIAEGDVFRRVGLGVDPAELVVSALRREDEFCDPGLSVDVGLSWPDGARAPAPIAVSAGAATSDAGVEILDPTDAAHRAVATQVLDPLGIKDGAGSVAQVVRADVDGDGTADELYVFARLSDPGTLLASEGDFSVVALRSGAGSSVTTQVLHQSIARNDPNTGETPFIEVGRLSAVVDLNGDGPPEVVVERRYYEGSFTEVLSSVRRSGLRRVLKAGCGV